MRFETAVLAFFLAMGGAAAQSAQSPSGNSSTRTFEGVIKRFECGDNCYLTVTNASGREVDGLCVAKACAPWNDATAIPRRLIGKKVKITTGVGVQRDAEGNVMGRMTSFRSIQFLN